MSKSYPQESRLCLILPGARNLRYIVELVAANHVAAWNRRFREIFSKQAPDWLRLTLLTLLTLRCIVSYVLPAPEVYFDTNKYICNEYNRLCNEAHMMCRQLFLAVTLAASSYNAIPTGVGTVFK